MKILQILMIFSNKITKMIIFLLYKGSNHVMQYNLNHDNNTNFISTPDVFLKNSSNQPDFYT